MNKTLKEKMIRHHEEQQRLFPNLYDKRWVEKAATDGWNEMVKRMKETEPRLGEMAERDEGYNVFAVIYYTAFEDALNTFFLQCTEDSLASVDLHLDAMQKLTAEMKTKEL